MPYERVSTTERLQALRALLAAENVDAFVIPTDDAHQSEYVAEQDRRRAFISGFDGSAGTAVVTANSALLWTDGRYCLQAEQQLDENWTLMKSGLPGVPSPQEWIATYLPAHARIGCDPFTISLSWSTALRSHALHALDSNPVDAVWGAARPVPAPVPAIAVPAARAGRTWEEKVAAVRAAMAAAGCTALVVCALDEVAWLFNIRGADVPYNPVLHAFAVVTPQAAILCVDAAKVAAVANALVGVTLRPYGDILPVLRALGGEVGARVWIDPARCSLAVYRAVKDGGADTHEKESPIQMMKAVKTAAELAGLRDAHVRDAVALVRFFAWLERAVQRGDVLDEVSVADVLEAERKKEDGFVSLSFPTISATGPNAAIIHYSPSRQSAARLQPNELYLCDSGAQFIDGTTDVTRTWCFGDPSARARDCYTRVLKGHVALARAVFPDTTSGFQLDTLARLALWEAGLDYRHGTGHGVGAFLNVHEGPHLLSFRCAPSTLLPLRSGMTVTDEPGYYEDGEFGIRIENVMVVTEADTPHRFGGARFLRLDSLTLVPHDVRLMNVSALTSDERAYIDRYHRQCWDTLSPRLDGEALEWLRVRTRPLPTTQ